MGTMLAFAALFLLTWISAGKAQSLLEIIGRYNLTELNATLSSHPALLSQFSDATNVTFLAPSNEAFRSFRSSSTGQVSREDPGLMPALLKYHLLQDVLSSISTLQIVTSMLNDSAYTNVTTGQVVGAARYLTDTIFLSGLGQNVTAIDGPLEFSGGVIYIIDDFLTLPPNTSEVAAANHVTKFVDCYELWGLNGLFNDVPDSTILLPIDNAFEMLGSSLDNLTTATLSRIASYHILNGSVLYQTLSTFVEFPTSLGSNYNVTIREVGGITFFVNNARILIPDLLTANGVVHIIDQVLNPENRSIVDLAASSSGIPAFADAYGSQTNGTSTPSLNPADQKSTPGSKIGAIVGGIVGGVLGVALTTFSIWFVRRKGYSFKLEKQPKSQAITRSDSDSAITRSESGSTERHEMPNSKNGLIHEAAADEKRLSEVPISGDRRAELPASNMEPAELEAEEVEVRPKDWKI